MAASRSLAGLGFAAAIAYIPLAQADGLDEIKPDAIAAVQAECRTRPYSMLLTVRNIRDAKGIITIDVHSNDPATWLKKGGKLARYRALPQKGQIQVCVGVDGPGAYAIALYQDKDVNFEINKNFLGLPAEPYGVSNDPPMGFGPPSLKDALVRVDGALVPARVTLHN